MNFEKYTNFVQMYNFWKKSDYNLKYIMWYIITVA